MGPTFRPSVSPFAQAEATLDRIEMVNMTGKGQLWNGCSLAIFGELAVWINVPGDECGNSQGLRYSRTNLERLPTGLTKEAWLMDQGYLDHASRPASALGLGRRAV